MPDSEIHWLGAAELGRRLRARELSPVEVATALLARIERLDPALHAYLTLTPDAALAAAKEAESELAGGRTRGPLHGVPVAVKDLCDTRGVRTTAGTWVLRERIPDADACVVERLRAAGAVILGKLSMTEGAWATHHPNVPVPRNPWDAERWPGVSSSGSGVATAAGLCFASLGSDTGGSIRFPSAANGIVGLKPTWGRVSRHGVFPLAHSLDHVGPMARRVEDVAAVLGIIAGPDPRDPTSLHAPVPDYTAGLEDRVRGLRVGIDERWCREDQDAGIADRVLACADVLHREGAVLRAVRFPDCRELVSLWAVLCAPETVLAHRGLFPERADEYGPGFRAFLELGRSLPATEYARADALRLAFRGQLAGLFDEVDVLLCPSLGVPLPPREPRLDGDDAPRELMRFTAPFDFSGSPTLSLPCGFTPDGLPTSLQLVGRHLEEAVLCRAGRAYERATDWHERHPPL
jgi:amidase